MKNDGFAPSAKLCPMTMKELQMGKSN